MNFFDKPLPTEPELIKKYNLYSDGQFPIDRKYYCCGEIKYVIDMITHTSWYHKKSMKESLRLLDEHMKKSVFIKKDNQK